MAPKADLTLKTFAHSNYQSFECYYFEIVVHLFTSAFYEHWYILNLNCVFILNNTALFTLWKEISNNKFRNLKCWNNNLWMKSYFMSLKMNGTYCILWLFLLYGICSTGMTDGCPDRCWCYEGTCKGVNCVAERLENVPTGIPNDTCKL